MSWLLWRALLRSSSAGLGEQAVGIDELGLSKSGLLRRYKTKGMAAFAHLERVSALSRGAVIIGSA